MRFSVLVGYADSYSELYREVKREEESNQEKSEVDAEGMIFDRKRACQLMGESAGLYTRRHQKARDGARSSPALRCRCQGVCACACVWSYGAAVVRCLPVWEPGASMRQHGASACCNRW